MRLHPWLLKERGSLSQLVGLIYRRGRMWLNPDSSRCAHFRPFVPYGLEKS